MPFSYSATSADWASIAPELSLLGAALVVMLIDIALPARLRGALASVAVLGVLSSLLSVGMLAQSGGGSAFDGMVASDHLALFGMLVVLVATGLSLLLAPGYIERQGVRQQGEFYALMLLAASGMLLLVAATSLMTIFLGIELLSLPLYVLCAFAPGQAAAREAGMKYFLLSSFASGFLLYGMALIYGATGATSLAAINHFAATHQIDTNSGFGPLLVAGIGLLIVGLAFKISAIPFHAWTPDVYQGAPTPVTALMSAGTKTAAFIALARVFTIALAPDLVVWQDLLVALAIVTMIGGNLLAATQTNVKRLLAYSSIAHAGYALIGIAAGTALGLSSALVYLASYAVMNIGAFGVLAVVERVAGAGTDLADLRGLGARRPWLAGALSVFLLALAGIPGTVGFVGKYTVFYAAVVAGQSELTIVGVIASMIGFYYYLRVIWAMYFVAPAEAQTSISGEVTLEPHGGRASAAAITKVVALAPVIPWTAVVGLALAVIGTVALGIAPGPLVTLARQAAGLP
jgi:NADH-quinone oxidoreductase subunit N